MIRKWSNRRLNVRRIVTSSVLLALVVAALLAGAQAVQAETAAIRCATFDDLTVGTSYAVGAKFSAGLEFEVLPYTWADGTVTNSGTIAVSNGLFAAGSGNELTVNNATLGLLLPSPSGVVGLTLRFGEYGGNVNVTINGDFRNIDNLSVLDGLTVGGAAVSVTGGLGNDAGELKVAGPISSFSIGGQEFFVDDLCLLKGEQEGPVDPQHPDHRPDLGDAPDSTNHAGKPNTAYPATGTLGHFPTVWDGTPAGAGTGPKHINPQLEGVLGKGLTAEADADPPAADADLINNILAGGDNANNDRLDDGWRNPGAPMPNCREATLTVRVWRGPAAALSRMYLNVWFDGNRDGDWEDTGECQRTDNTGPVARSFEWIVQDFAVNMGAIPKGGYVDIPVNTLLVMNVDGEHDEGLQWMRFTLSEAPAIANPATSLADGRGPDAPNAFQYGETEDYLRRPEHDGLPGTLHLDKTVEPATAPLHPGDFMTYTVHIKHEGGESPAFTLMRDALPPDVLLAGPVKVVEEAPYVSPLLAHVHEGVVKWEGALTPGAQVAIHIPVRVARCMGEGRVIVNEATILQTNGTLVSDRVETAVECPPAPPVEVVKSIVEVRDGNEVEVREADIVPGMSVKFRFRLHNGSDVPVVVPLRDRLPDGLVTVDEGAIGNTLDKVFHLKPGETKVFDFRAKLVEDLRAENTLVNVGRYIVCRNDLETAIVCAWPPENDPVIHVTNQVKLFVKGRDLGDAPDSTNHFGAGMTAYGGVPAQYPTVVDPATGPQGPAHNNPLPFHLGKYVSREANADIGPDADATNNILPKPDVADRDRFDDGIAIGRLAFEHCRPATIPVQLFIAPGVSSLLEQGKGYLNVWVDGMRNGDWKDVAECAVDAGQTPELAFEHIIIDYPIDVTTLGPGLHVINVPAQNVLWPADKAEQPAWLRATLSERPANKPLTAGSVRYGDGRGYDDPFRLGETEDYLWRAAQDPKHGPDLFVHKQGVAKPAEIEPSGDGNPETGDGQGFDGIVWVIEYGNRGAATATNVRVVDDLSKAGDLSRLAIETRPELEVTRDGGRLIFKVGTLEPGQHGRIVIKVGIPANTASASFYNVAEIAGDYDINPENNRADATVKLELLAPIIVAPGNGTTCDGDLTVWGRAIPGSEIDVYVDDLMDGTTTTDSSGRWSYAMTLADGTHTIYAVARYGAFTSAPSRTVTVIVDSSLVWKPLSLRFTNELGWSHRPVDENGRTDESGWYVRLRPGMTYTVSIELCCSDPNASVQMVISDTETIDLTDDDSDGVYTGAFTAGDQPHTSGSIMIVAQCGSTEVTGSGTTLIDPEGVVYDVKSAAPLAASTVACMQAGTTGAGSGSATTYTLWPAADFGQVNPQSTGSDGYFSFFTPAGTYQLAVSRSGYQSYRSTDIQVVSDPVRYDVALTPQIDAAANHVVVITEYGFEPAYLAVRPGDVVEWVNMTADGHTATSYKTQAGAAAVGEANFDSGLLLAGEQYKFRFDSAASYTYVDAANPANSGTVVVAQDAGINTLFLPVVSR